MKHFYEPPSKLRWQKTVSVRAKSKALLLGIVSIIFLSIPFRSTGQTANFGYTGSVQTYTVPAGVTRISIEAFGAQGGGTAGGKGARIKGEISVTPNEVLQIMVGGQGGVTTQGPYCSGGGGGTFIYRNASDPLPLLVAGGGGGQSEGQTAGGPGSSSLESTNGASMSGNATGGLNGNGGSGGINVGVFSTAGGGAGWLSDGGNGLQLRNPAGQGGKAPRNGGAGGVYTHPSYTGANGGFGGGGSGSDNSGAGGGGGGFNGGGGGNNYLMNGNKWGSGGGGGSYNSGSNQINEAGVNSGNGKVIVTVLQNTYYQDVDADGYGNSAVSVSALTAPTGYVTVGGDCNDNDPTIHPGAVDLCDGIDRNCDGIVLARPTGTISGNNSICAGQSTTLTIQLTGTAPWNITYTDGTTPVTVNGVLTSPYTVSVSPTSSKTYTLISVSDAKCEATALTGNAVVNVKTGPTLKQIDPIVVTNDPDKCGAVVEYNISNKLIFQQDFVNGQPTSATNSCENWEAFRKSLLETNTYKKLTIKGSLNTTGVSITNPALISQLANALRTNTSVTVNDGVRTWKTGLCGNGIELSAENSICSCPEGFIVRPCIGNENWGGAGTATCGAPSQTLIVEFELASDDCNGPVTITQKAGLPSGSLFPIGTTTNTFIAEDGAGNTSTMSFDVTVTDKQKPTVLTKDITIQVDVNGKALLTPEMVNNGSTDNCSIPENGYSLDRTSFDCSNLGPNTVTLTVTDVYGNTASKTAVVTVEDKIAPTAVAKDITVQLAANGEAVITPEMVNNGSSDLCGPVTLSLSKSTFDCRNLGENTVTLTVTDASGNTKTATATVTVEDKIAPVAKAKNITVQLNIDNTVTVAASDVNNGSTDNCGIASLSLDKTTFNCSNLGANTVLLTVTDNSGNTHTATATVTVEDKIKPVAKAKNITAQLEANGTVTITAAEVDNGSTDNCGIASLALSKTTFNCANVGANTVTLTVTDNSGNTHTATATVTVEDKIVPTITAPADVTVDVDPGKTTASQVALDVPVTSDNCAVAGVTNDAPATYPTGTTTVTWTVTDASGNTATATQTVTVRLNVVSVVQPALLEVPIRTTFAQVNKPATVEATFSNGSKEQVPVTWQPGAYNGLVNGDYELTGTLSVPAGSTNVNNVVAKWTVRVMPNKAPTNITLSTTSFKPEISKDEVLATLNTVDEDDPIDNQPENQHQYELVSGAGSTDNALFEIDGNQLYLKSNYGLSGKTQFSIRVRTIDPYNNTFEKSFTLTKGGYAKPTIELKLVNAFSPNGDGINDNWTVPELRFYNEVEIEVFDRAGIRVFRTTNPETGWDGRNQNGQVLEGAYLYVIRVKDVDFVKRGTVTVLKKR